MNSLKRLITKKALRTLLLWEKRPRAASYVCWHLIQYGCSCHHWLKYHAHMDVFRTCILFFLSHPPSVLCLLYSSHGCENTRIPAMHQDSRDQSPGLSHDNMTLHMGYIFSHNLMQRFAAPHHRCCPRSTIPLTATVQQKEYVPVP